MELSFKASALNEPLAGS